MIWYLLGFVLIALKVTGVVAWSWLIILLPFAIPAIISLIGIAFVGFMLVVAALIAIYKTRKDDDASRRKDW